MPESNNTSSETEMEGSEVSRTKESFRELLKEVATDVLAAIGKAVHRKYTAERIDGKPRFPADDDEEAKDATLL